MLLLLIGLLIGLFIDTTIAITIDNPCGSLNTVQYANANNLTFNGRFFRPRSFDWESLVRFNMNRTVLITDIMKASGGTCLCLDFTAAESRRMDTRCVTKGTKEHFRVIMLKVEEWLS